MLLMNTHNICSHGEIRQLSTYLVEKKSHRRYLGLFDDNSGIIFSSSLLKHILWVLIRRASEKSQKYH